MRTKRAEDIARELNNTERWHSHSRGISMEVLRRELNLQIEDLADKRAVAQRVRDYHGLLKDYSMKLGFSGVMHTLDRFVPLAGLYHGEST